MNDSSVGDYVNQLEEAYAIEKQRNESLAVASQSNFSMTEDNLIRWQLDLKEDLDRIHHLLKGDTIEEIGSGDVVYVPATEDGLKPFNEFGVQLIMNILQFYLNRNTLLSNYNEETINWKVYEFGLDISDLVHNRYQEMGMDTKDKIKMYPMVVRELVDTVHSAYLRALRAGERESLRTARTVTQTDAVGDMQMGMQKPSKSLWKPSTWAN